LAVSFAAAGCTETQQTTMKGGMIGAAGGGAIGAIGGNAALGMTVGRVVGMSAGYIYSRNKQGSE
jgi:hypothetical protein